jgi:hypothetical protein
MIVEQYVSFAPKVTIPETPTRQEELVAERVNTLKKAKRVELESKRPLQNLQNLSSNSEKRPNVPQTNTFQQLYEENLKQLRAKVASAVTSRPKPPPKPVYLPSAHHASRPSLSPYSFKPRLSKKSLDIASRLGDPKERLTALRPKEAISTPETDFRPHIDPRSRVIDHRSRSPITRWEALYDLAKEKEVQEPGEVLDPECTFHPRIRREGWDGDVVERLMDWEKERERQLRAAQDNYAGKDLEECTFTPIRQVTDTVQSSKRGIEGFLERQAALRHKSPSPIRAPEAESAENSVDYEAAIKALHMRLQDL